MLLDVAGVYHEAELDFHYGFIYILFMMNVSITYAFIVLASFYATLKCKLKPYEPVGKFLCIKFVIFFAFWQSVVITGLVKIGVIGAMGSYDARSVSTGLQDFLICIEMFWAAVAFTYTFSYIPFTDGYVNPVLLAQYENDDENAAALEAFMKQRGQPVGAADDMDRVFGDKHAPPKQHSNATNIYSKWRRGRGNSSEGHSTNSTNSAGKSGSTASNSRTIGLLNMLRNGAYSSDKATGGFDSLATAPARSSSSSSSSVAAASYSAPTAVSGGSNSSNSSVSSSYQLVSMSNSSDGPGTGTSAGNPLHGNKHQRTSHSSTSSISSSSVGHKTFDHRLNKQASNNSVASHSLAGNLLNHHFAADSAIRDFNETMPVVVLPTRFHVRQGVVMNSDPASRLRELMRESEEEEQDTV
jgi:hypothetical protein